MEMRRRMLPREDADHDAKESGYLRHRNILLLVCLLINSLTCERISGGRVLPSDSTVRRPLDAPVQVSRYAAGDPHRDNQPLLPAVTSSVSV
jgi:hypothetical protein